MSKTKIEWARNADGSQGQTWNPVRGCSRISPGCVNCYAERHAARFSDSHQPSKILPHVRVENPQPFHLYAERTPSGPRWTGKVELIEHMLDVPLRTRKPTVFFVNSMSDLFHEALPDADILRVFDVMRRCHARGHTFQILTKRASRMRELCSRMRWDDSGEGRMFLADSGSLLMPLMKYVWLGVSTEDQPRADERIPHLLKTPAAVRFLSVEPLLGPVDLTRIEFRLATWYDALKDHDGFGLLGAAHRKLDWVIVGGESGPGARPMHLEWAQAILQQCKSAGIAVFMKQVGAKPYAELSAGDSWNAAAVDAFPLGTRFSQRLPGESVHEIHLKDKKGGVMDEWPQDLRVRQMPEVTR